VTEGDLKGTIEGKKTQKSFGLKLMTLSRLGIILMINVHYCELKRSLMRWETDFEIKRAA
jgi:hypothetical protein